MADLNKPATKPGSFYTKEGLPRWYLWDGGYFAIGKAGGEVPMHAHHAIQVFLAFEGRAAIRGPDGVWLAGRGVIVKPDVEHGFNAQDSWGAMLFVDAESAEGRWLRSMLTQDVTVVPEARLAGCQAELRRFWEDPLGAKDPGDLIRHCVRALCAGSPPTRKPDARVARCWPRFRSRRTCACRSKTPPGSCTCRPTASPTCSSSRSGCRSGATCCGGS